MIKLLLNIIILYFIMHNNLFAYTNDICKCDPNKTLDQWYSDSTIVALIKTNKDNFSNNFSTHKIKLIKKLKGNVSDRLKIKVNQIDWSCDLFLKNNKLYLIFAEFDKEQEYLKVSSCSPSTNKSDEIKYMINSLLIN